MSPDPDDPGDRLGPSRAAAENLLLLAVIALVLLAVAAAVFWSIPD